MVILHVASITNDNFSGVCNVVPIYIREQERLGHSVALLNINNTEISGISHQISVNGIVKLDKLPKPFDKPDIVVFQECYRKEYPAIAKQLFEKEIPYIIIPHGELGKEAQQKKHLKKVMANLLYFNKFIKNSSALQCLSKREIEGTRFGRKKILATNGVDLPESFKVNSQDGINGIRFIYIGRLDAYHKGLDLLITAVKGIYKTMKEQQIIIDIYGPDYNGRYAHLEDLIAEAGVKDIVKLHHEISGKDKEKELLKSDVFIQTSRFEGMPLGILEALSYGLPCVVTNGTTLAEIICKYNAGWDAGDSVEGIRNAILECIRVRKTWDEMSENARKLVVEEYCWNQIMNETIEQYKQFVS